MPSSFRPTSNRRRRSMVLAILLLFQIWVFSSRAAAAARILPHDGAAARNVKALSHDSAGGHSSDRDSISSSGKGNYRVSNTEHFRRYFSGHPPPPPSSSGSAAAAAAGGAGFEESKRKVPSCPDPLHN
ncbi:unnamed protein product [Linum trigynum]|uniref:Uncharacterized protein n=1 Tax=Linum trigynum TaxID=586398 RepID=A0AAV2GEB7_9ROSI